MSALDTTHPPVPLAPGYYCQTSGWFPDLYPVVALVPVEERERIVWRPAKIAGDGTLKPITEITSNPYSMDYYTPEEAEEIQAGLVKVRELHDRVETAADEVLRDLTTEDGMPLEDYLDRVTKAAGCHRAYAHLAIWHLDCVVRGDQIFVRPDIEENER